MLRIIRNLLLILGVFGLSSCAYLLNDREVEVAIDSSPPGADIIIGGRNYGQTPKVLRLEPKEYDVTLNKEGHGSASFKMEAWQAIRSNKSEGKRCLADALGTVLVLPAISYWSIYCRDFKEPFYSADIPYMGPGRGASQSFSGGRGGANNDGYYSGQQQGGRQEYYQQQGYPGSVYRGY